jgi:hypothetical protein
MEQFSEILVSYPASHKAHCPREFSFAFFWFCSVYSNLRSLLFQKYFGLHIYISPMTKPKHGKWERHSSGKWLLLTTVHLVTTVIAVHNAITHQMSLEALTTRTLEIARASFLYAAHLIWRIWTVVHRVTLCHLTHAVRSLTWSPIHALKLTCKTNWFPYPVYLIYLLLFYLVTLSQAVQWI